MKQNQFKFEPFDQVLVRDFDDRKWNPATYKYYDKDTSDLPHVCDGFIRWAQCIPYNNETKHLRGTDKPYKPKQKEIRYEVTYGFGEDLAVELFNEMEFKKFIDVAVCNNKDIKDFTVNMIIPD
jgi:hypothetical protein